MRTGALTTAALVLIATTACGGDETPAPVVTPAPTAATPAPSPTPASHQLVITVRDEVPLGAYVADGTLCSLAVADVPAVVVVSDANGEEIASQAAPATAQLAEDGSCRTDPIVVSVPYSPSYDLGVAVDGDGVFDPETDLPPTVVETAGDSQDVTVVG